MEDVLVTVVSGLWADFLLPYIGAGAAVPRNEEAIFLRHLRSSAHWGRVLEAVGVHRERQEAFDAQEFSPGTSVGVYSRKNWMADCGGV